MDESTMDEHLFIQADLLARFVEGKLSPNLTAEIEAYLQASPEAQDLVDAAREALMEAEANPAADWPERIGAITHNPYRRDEWLPSLFLDEEALQTMASANTGERPIIDSFDNGVIAYQLFWQGETLFVELSTTDPDLWRAKARALLLTPEGDAPEQTGVNADVTLELVMDAQDSNKCTCCQALPLTGTLAPTSRLFLSMPCNPWKVDGKLRPGDVSSDGFPQALAEPRFVAARKVEDTSSQERSLGHLRIAVEANGLSCALFWDNLNRQLHLRAQVTDAAHLGKQFLFTVTVGSDANETVVGQVSHRFTALEVRLERSFPLTEDQSRGGNAVTMRVAEEKERPNEP